VFNPCELKTTIPGNPFQGVSMIHHYTDGARQHFKSKNVLWVLSHHHEIFGCNATWSYTASGHGKGVCDGVGGTLKMALRRFALREDKYRVDRVGLVTDAQSVLDWNLMKYSTSSTRIIVGLIEKRSLNNFRDRFKDALSDAARPVPNVSYYHHFKCTSPGVLACHRTSLSINHEICPLDRFNCTDLVDNLRLCVV